MSPTLVLFVVIRNFEIENNRITVSSRIVGKAISELRALHIDEEQYMQVDK